MKKIALFLAASALVVSCKNLAENEFKINGSVNDPLLEGKNVFIEKQGPTGFVAVDTVKIKGGKFEFKDTVSSPTLRYLSFEGKTDQKVNFVLEHGAIDIEVDKDTLYKSVLSGTYNNEKLEEFKKMSDVVYKKSKKYEKENTAKRNEALKINDTVTLNKLMKARLQINKDWEKDLIAFIKKNPKAYCDIFALGQIAQMGNKKMDEVKALYEGLDPVVKKTKEGKQIGEYFAKLEKEKAPQEQAGTGVKTGDTAPDFTAPAPDGKSFSLKQAMGKVTIIDFWASWCKPCRAENPNVVALYNELHAKGLNIISVSLDKEAAAWKKAITDDKLTWNHVSNLKFWEDPIAKQYGVTQIPATFILDGTGKIVAKDLRGAELKAKVLELLK